MCFILYVCVTYLCVTDMAYMSDVCVCDRYGIYVRYCVWETFCGTDVRDMCESDFMWQSHTPHLFRTQSHPPIFLLQGQIHIWSQTPTHIPIQNPDMPPRYSKDIEHYTDYRLISTEKVSISLFLQLFTDIMLS